MIWAGPREGSHSSPSKPHIGVFPLKWHSHMLWLLSIVVRPYEFHLSQDHAFAFRNYLTTPNRAANSFWFVRPFPFTCSPWWVGWWQLRKTSIFWTDINIFGGFAVRNVIQIVSEASEFIDSIIWCSIDRHKLVHWKCYISIVVTFKHLRVINCLYHY